MKKAFVVLTSHNKFHISLGLERIEKILALLNNPQNSYQIIHIAGTNGKGSTSKLINDFLIEHFSSLAKIGLFTSPHLFKYNERIKINNKEIDDDLLDKLINEIDDLAKNNSIELTEFELIAAVAFYYFKIQKVDYVVLEVGLGGLYDATNIVANSIAIITTLDLDHTERLGKTIEEIALQKAGIIKENSNVVIAKDNLGYEVVEKFAIKKNAKIIDLPSVEVKFEEKNYALINNEKFEFNLLGSHQAKNLALVLGALKALNINLSNKTIEKVLKNIVWKFRLEYHKEKNILIDAGHNPSGIKALKAFLCENFKNEKKVFIFGCLKNKDYKTMLDILDLKENELYFFEFDYPNALKFDDLEKKYQAKKLSSIEEIKELIDKKECLKIFSGSIYMLGKIFSEIKI